MSSNIGVEHFWTRSDYSDPAPAVWSPITNDFTRRQSDSQGLWAQSSRKLLDRTGSWSNISKNPGDQFLAGYKDRCTFVQGNSETNADRTRRECVQIKHAAASDLYLIPELDGNVLRNQSYLHFYNAALLGPSLLNENWLIPEAEGLADDELLLGMSCGYYNERGPKRKQAYIWQCCNCGQGGISIKSEACRSCGYPRCAYCPVSKVRI
ncbi:uncharacterized protein LY79DRAFT_551674 [Colletotrichum navitas]|uniref:Uncharacterized protein n=1 Tax=Colletotrichum navitas TaxID=681940 RepID=A0AAD8V5H0_9PEZI|nr:uncharacterized protein LY79DRAFT_551674 [Colletotrichum navitas]KAK1593689.1 hypothetical protein LY79DRAFT_551674 [Colletotrichum navitas]